MLNNQLICTTDLHRSHVHAHMRWQWRTAALQLQMTRREKVQGQRLFTPGRQAQHLHENADLPGRPIVISELLGL